MKFSFYSPHLKANINRIKEADANGFSPAETADIFQKSGINISPNDVKALLRVSESDFVTKSLQKKMVARKGQNTKPTSIVTVFRHPPLAT